MTYRPETWGEKPDLGQYELTGKAHALIDKVVDLGEDKMTDYVLHSLNQMILVCDAWKKGKDERV